MARHISCLLLLFSTIAGTIGSENTVNFLIGSNDNVQIINSSNVQSPRQIMTTDDSVYRVDFHYNKNLVFARDGAGRLLKSTLFPTENTAPPPVELLRIRECSGFAVDWVFDRIFLANCSRNSASINIVNLEGIKSMTVKSWERFNNIEYIVVDPYCGVLFWVRDKKVESCRTDGEHFRTNMSFPDVKVEGIALDIPNQRVFYVGYIGESGTPYSFDYCGTEPKTHYHIEGIVYGMGVIRGDLYWIGFDNQTDFLYKASLTNPMTKVVIDLASDLVCDMKLVDPELQKAPNTIRSYPRSCSSRSDIPATKYSPVIDE